MKKKILLVLLIVFCGCKQDAQKKIIVLKEFYPDGTIKAEYETMHSVGTNWLSLHSWGEWQSVNH